MKRTTKTIYRTLPTHLAKNQDSVPSHDNETLNKNFATIGSKLSEALPKSKCKLFRPTIEKTTVLTNSRKNEVHTLMKNLKNKKVLAMMESVMKFRNVVHQ